MAEHLLGTQPVTKLEARHAQRLGDLVRRYVIHDRVVEQTCATIARWICTSPPRELPDLGLSDSLAGDAAPRDEERLDTSFRPALFHGPPHKVTGEFTLARRKHA
jgi:hypothetical protein